MLFCVHSGAFLCGADVFCAVMISMLEVIGMKQLKKVQYLYLRLTKKGNGLEPAMFLFAFWP